MAKTASRKVLGCMNDLAFAAEVPVDRSSGLARADVAYLNQRLRRRILMPLGGVYPIELVEHRVGG